MSSGHDTPGPECESGETRQLRAEVAELRARIVRMECDRPTSARPGCKEPWLDPSTAFTSGALSMLVMIALVG